MTKFVRESNYSRVLAEEGMQQQTPNSDWRGHGSLIFLILKLGHCIFNSNLGILMLGDQAQDEDQTDGAGRPGCISSR